MTLVMDIIKQHDEFIKEAKEMIEEISNAKTSGPIGEIIQEYLFNVGRCKSYVMRHNKFIGNVE